MNHQDTTVKEKFLPILIRNIISKVHGSDVFSINQNRNGPSRFYMNLDETVKIKS